MANAFEPQSKLLRSLVLSPFKQSSWGTAAALPMGALTYVQRFDGSAVIDLNPTRRSDAMMSGKRSHFATNGQVTGWDLKISGVKTEASAWTLGYALAFLLGKDTVVGSSAPYTHTMAFDESTRQAVPTTAFLQDTDGLLFFVPDLHVAKLTITIPAQGAIQLEWDFIGTGFLNQVAPAAYAATLAAIPAVPNEIYVLGNDADFQLGPVGAPVSTLGRNQTTTIVLDWQSSVNRSTGSGLYGTFVRKGSPKFSFTSTVAAVATDDIFTRLLNNTATALKIVAQSDPHAALTVSLPNVNLKSAKMGFDDDMVVWNLEGDETTCYQQAANDVLHRTPGVVLREKRGVRPFFNWLQRVTSSTGDTLSPLHRTTRRTLRAVRPHPSRPATPGPSPGSCEIDQISMKDFPMLELKQQRILPGNILGTLYHYTVRRITEAEWLQYFDSVLYEQQLVDGAVVNTNDSSGARLELLRKVLLDAQGYEVESGHPLTDMKDWQDLLPVSHRIAFADLLFECGLDTSAAAPAMLGAELVTLRCRWTASADGKSLVEHKGLKHVFSTPSVEQLREYSRDSSRSRIVGGRKGKTQFLGAQRTLVKLYDQLIQRVEGYSVDGTSLDRDRDRIVAEMDTFHKSQAMGQVFAPADTDIFGGEVTQ